MGYFVFEKSNDIFITIRNGINKFFFIKIPPYCKIISYTGIFENMEI